MLWIVGEQEKTCPCSTLTYQIKKS